MPFPKATVSSRPLAGVPLLTAIAILFLVPGALLAEIDPTGLVGYYAFDADSAADTSSSVGGSASTNDGTWTGTATYKAGVFGRAAEVGDGSGSNYITASGSEYVFGTGSFTILYGGGKNWSSSGGTLGWVSAISGDDVKANISDGSTRKDSAYIDLDQDTYWGDSRDHWTLVALVVDRDAQTLSNYVLDDNVTTIGDDSSAPSTVSISGLGSVTGSNQNIVVGQDGDFAGYGTTYAGLPATGIDDLSVWARALSQAEIQEIYTGGRAASPLADLLGEPAATQLTTTLDKEAGAVALSWIAYDLTGLAAPEVRVTRDGTPLATVLATATSYLDAPPAPVDSPVTYVYQVELFDGTVVVPDTAAQSSVTWSPGGIAYDLLANYRFEDGFRDTASATPAHDGTVVNGANITGNGVYGKCVNFLDQLKQGVNVPDHPTLDFGNSMDFTVSLWMKREGAMITGLPNGEAGDGVILCKQDWSNGANPGWGIYATSDGGVKWNLAGSSRKSGDIATGASGVADGRWHHILVSNTRTGSARCFVDGVFKTSITISGAGSVDNAMALSMGVDGNGNHSWKGSLDEVAIWNRALDDAEALEVFRSSTRGLALSGKSIVDSDHDGMNDDWEIAHFGNLAQTAEGDFDKDGRSNFLEYTEGSDPTSGARVFASRLTGEEFAGQTYPVLHYLRPTLPGDVIYIPEASSDLKNWTGGDDKFTPFGNPVDKGNGQEEYHVRYYQSMSAVTSGQRMCRVRMESRYQAAIGEDLSPTVELRNGQAVVSWTTAEPSVTILNYGYEGGPANRYEDYGLSTCHEVIIDGIQPGQAFAYTVIQVQDGVETRSKTYSISGLWDYSPPPVPDQGGYDSGGNWAARAAEILALPGVLDRGYGLDYLCGDGRLAYELVRQSQLVVIGVENTQAEVDLARAFLTERGVYGSRVTVVLASDLANLPFPSDFFNLVVSQSQVAAGSGYTTLKSAVEKHAIPARGVVAGLDGGAMHADAPKPAHSGTGSWTMEYGSPANTSASTEEFSGKTSMSEFELRWLGSPGPELAWDRQVAEQAPLAKNGRFYCQGRGRILALDSHNGSVLWTKELDDAQRFNLLRDAGNLSADDEAVWLSLRKECWKMDGDTGHITVFPLKEGPRTDLDYSWNYICSTGGHLLGSSSVDDAFYKEHWGAQFWYTDAGGSLANQVVSDNLFSLDRDTGALNWEYADGLILSVSITVGDGKVFFLETRNPSALSGSLRRLPVSTWKQDLHLVCLDLATGTTLWDKASSFTGGSQTVFLMLDAPSGKLVLSAGDGTNHLYAYDSADGTPGWSKSYSVHKSDHGGKNQHPVISGGEIFLAPNVLDIATGNVKRSTIPSNAGKGCNTYWGSKNLLFYRTGYSGNGLSMWPTSGGSTTGIDHIKGACWLNWAPADGMFLIQEKSAGCSCGAWVHISLGWGPKE